MIQMNYNFQFSKEEFLNMQNPKMVSQLKEYMEKENIDIIRINEYVIDKADNEFKNIQNSNNLNELDNILNLYQFFIRYQYYNYALLVREKMHCKIR